MDIEKKDDPIVERTIGKKELQMRESHKLPLYYNACPFYDRALPRVSKEIAKIDGWLSFVDVGANIGDTVSLVTDEVQGSFLCVDGDKEYLQFLKVNTGRIKGSNVIIEESYCSDSGNNDKFKVERFDGTAKLEIRETGEEGDHVNFKSLDEIIGKHEAFENANVLKIDTDGFEINVLQGGNDFLDRAKPVIYFEFVPELYMNNKQDPMYIFDFLEKKGYQKALFYDNFGLPIEILDISNKKRILELNELIDNEKIYYYDILTWHNSKHDKYRDIFNNELKVGKNEV